MRLTVNTTALDARLASPHAGGWTYAVADRGLAGVGSYAAIMDQCRAGLGRVVLDRPVDLRDMTEQVVRRLALVRDLTSCSVAVDWTLRCGDDDDVAGLHGLQPPTAGAHPGLDAWRRAFRYGLLYWRAGPGFIIVRDARQGHIDVMTLSGGPYVKAFEAGLPGCRLGQVDPQAAAALVADRIMFARDNWLLSLPYRMRHWPIPCNAV